MLIEKLEHCIDEGSETSEVEDILKSLQLRSGTFGEERKNMINNLFKSVIEMNFPDYAKYLFWSSTTNKGIFDLSKY